MYWAYLCGFTVKGTQGTTGTVVYMGLRKKNMNSNGQASFFDPDPTQGDGSGSETIQSVAEVFDLVRQLFGAPADGKTSAEVPAFIARGRERRARRAAEVGLTARWSRQFGFVELHDSTTGEWHDVHTKNAPSWAKWEAGKRKELYKAGDRSAYDRTSAEMQELWDLEHPPDEEGIIEDHPLPG